MANTVNIKQIKQILSNTVQMGLWDESFTEIFREGQRVVEMSAPLTFPGFSNLVYVRIRNLKTGRIEMSKFKADGRPLKEFIRHIDVDGIRFMKHVTGKIHYLGGWNSLHGTEFWYPDCQWRIPVGCSYGDVATL